MDQDDAEKRIAELERQLAEQKRMPEQVHKLAFSDAVPRPRLPPRRG
jgi:uncharacterized coiled-coil protein SlyX